MMIMRGLLGSLLGLIGVLLAAAPAQADESLVATLPQTRQELGDLPTEVRLAFSMAVSDGEMTVTNSQGQPVLAESTVVEINNISSRLKFNLPRDTYTVKYRVTSADTDRTYGGSFQFSLGPGQFTTLPEKEFGGASNVPPSLAAGTSDPEVTATPSPATLDPTPSGTDPNGSANSDADADSQSDRWWPWVAGGIALLAILGLALLVYRRRQDGQATDVDTVTF